MPNPKIVTNGTHELQERYSNLVLAKLRSVTIFEPLMNRRYEGNPKAGAVKIPVRDTEMVVGDYDVVAGGDLSTSTTTYLTLPIDKNKYVNELIDGFEAEAVPALPVSADTVASSSTVCRTVSAESERSADPEAVSPAGISEIPEKATGIISSADSPAVSVSDPARVPEAALPSVFSVFQEETIVLLLSVVCGAGSSVCGMEPVTADSVLV